MSPLAIKPSSNRFFAAVDGFREHRPLRLHDVQESKAPTCASNRVLLLEDDSALNAMLADFLRKNGLEVIAVHNGVEGVHQVLESDFEVILCDLMMPGLPGDIFFRAVGRMRPHLCERFIFMTGHCASQNLEKLVASGRNSVLPKPFAFGDLLELIAFVRVRNIQLAA